MLNSNLSDYFVRRRQQAKQYFVCYLFSMNPSQARVRYIRMVVKSIEDGIQRGIARLMGIRAVWGEARGEGRRRCGRPDDGRARLRLIATLCHGGYE